MAELFRNGATSTLASGITDSATSLTVASGHGSRFPSPTGGDFFRVSLEDTGGNVEYCFCTGRSGDVLTVTRGQEGSATAPFASGSRVELRPTAGMLEAIHDKFDTTVPADRVVSAGSGLTGGGDLSANRTITMGTPSTLTGSTGNTVTASSHTHNVSLTAANVGAPPTSRTITAGNGVTGGGDLSANRTITLGTPATLTAETSNGVTASSHTHAIGAGVMKAHVTTGGATTVSTSAPSGSATNGDHWLQVD